MSEDTDIVFEGHELHRYLQEQGYSDYEVASTRNVTSSKSAQQVLQETVNTLRRLFQMIMPGCEAANKKECKLWQHLALLHAHWSAFLFCIRVNHITEERMIKKVLTARFEQNCRTRIAILQGIVQPISRLTRRFRSEVSLLYGIGICVITRTWRKDLLPWLIPAVYTCVAAGHFVNTWYVHKQKKKFAVTLLALLHVLKEMTCQTRRIILFIQENELLLRGFTLARSRTAVMDDLKSLRSSWYLMTGLRERIAQVMNDITGILKCATIELIREFPLKGQLDHEHNYAAFLIEEELGITTSDADNINKYTLGYLKRLRNINMLLQSEFLRHYALCCMPSLWNDEFQSLNPLLKTTDSVSRTLCSFVESLTLAYKFYSCYGKCEGNINQQPQPLVCSVTDVFVGVHSARLYMQGILHRTMQIEEMLEQSKQEADDVNHIFNELVDITNKMTSCTNCIEIALSFCKSSEVNFEPAVEVTPTSLSLNCANVQEIEPIAVGYSDFDPKVEDEVFEALVDHNVDKDDYDDLCDIKIEKENEQQKAYSMRMMSELKTVLMYKAEEMKKREECVLRNKGILIMKDSSDCEADISQMETENVFEDDTLKSEVIDSLTSEVLDFLKSSIDSSSGGQSNNIKSQTSDESWSTVGLHFKVLGKSLVGEEETFGDLAESVTDEMDDINTS